MVAGGSGAKPPASAGPISQLESSAARLDRILAIRSVHRVVDYGDASDVRRVRSTVALLRPTRRVSLSNMRPLDRTPLRGSEVSHVCWPTGTTEPLRSPDPPLRRTVGALRTSLLPTP